MRKKTADLLSLVEPHRRDCDADNSADRLELALDASDTIGANNSLEKMMVHQMAVLHRQIMKLTARMDDMQLPPFYWTVPGVEHDGFRNPARYLYRDPP
jgi:hypothetical protein